MKHLFLSGDINVGKSTMIQNLIKNLNIKQEEIGGFYTRAYLEKSRVKGFYFDPIHVHFKIPNIQDRLIGYTPDGNRWVSIEETFEKLGVQVLNQCIKYPFKFIIMDELGFFENHCLRFQQKVHETLSSGKKVLGVIKPFSTPFMDSIRKRRDVIEVEVTKDNREDLIKILTNQFRL